ncbi:hypothetical protein GCM10010972_11560 [Cellulomonas carbonis]|nr:hypothetical protein GCM10010972_11560 [Cellulomonas carbonis]
MARDSPTRTRISTRLGDLGAVATARLVAVVAACLAVADGFRWGNRWYVSSVFAGDPETQGHALEILSSAHSALVDGLVELSVAAVAAVIGWRLRVVRHA